MLRLAIIVLAAGFSYAPLRVATKSRCGLDWVGSGIPGDHQSWRHCFWLIESSRLGIFYLVIIAARIEGGLVALVIFLLIEARKQNPMLPLAMFRSRNFSGANLLTLLLVYSAEWRPIFSAAQPNPGAGL